MGEMTYINEWAGRVRMARLTREAGEPLPDPKPPENYTPADIEFALKLVAHWEGGPGPEDPAAWPVVLELEEEP